MTCRQVSHDVVIGICIPGIGDMWPRLMSGIVDLGGGERKASQSMQWMSREDAWWLGMQVSMSFLVGFWECPPDH